MDAYLNQVFKDAGWGVEGDVFHCTHASDRDKIAQCCCLCHQHPLASQPTIRHCFGDFIRDGRLEPSISAMLASSVPDESLPVTEKAEVYDCIADMLLSDPMQSLKAGTTAWCFRHLRYCPIVERIDAVAPGSTLKVDWKHKLHDDATQADGDEYKGIIDTDAVTSTEAHIRDDFWARVAAAAHAENSTAQPEVGKKVVDQKEELLCNVAGTSCTDYAGYGDHEGAGGATQLAYLNWCLDILSIRPIMWWTEIAGGSIDMYRKRLGHVYNIFGVETEPLREGLPWHRCRLYCYGSCKVRVLFDGSSEEYFGLVLRRCNLVAADYLVGDEHRRLKLASQRAARRGHVHPPAETKIPLCHQFSALTMTRIDDQMEALGFVTSSDEKSGIVIDADQNNSHTCGGWVGPCLVTHATLLAVDGAKVLLPEEHLLSQGESCCCQSEVDPKWQGCLEPLINILKRSDNGNAALVKLAGNAMNAINLYSFKLYTLSCSKVAC